MYSASYLNCYLHLMINTLVKSRPLRLYHTCIYIVFYVKVVTYLPLYREWSIKTLTPIKLEGDLLTLRIAF